MGKCTIRTLRSEIAGGFILKNREKEDQITFNKNGKFWGCFNSDDMLVAVISTNETINTIRIKSFLTLKEFRNSGIGSKLVEFVISTNNENKVITAFATQFSFSIFKKYGFETVSENKNNIKFMRRIKNV